MTDITARLAGTRQAFTKWLDSNLSPFSTANEVNAAWRGWRAALAAYESERVGWQPIETAPKDGTLILLYRPLAGRTNDPVIAIKRGVPRDTGCWEETVPHGMDDSNYTDGCCKATHWMPLPAAPVQP